MRIFVQNCWILGQVYLTSCMGTVIITTFYSERATGGIKMFYLVESLTLPCFPAESAPEGASATSCTWSPSRGNYEGSCTAAARKGTQSSESSTFTLDQWGFVNSPFSSPPHQERLGVALPGKTLPFEGPTAGAREAEKVEGPRALWKVLNWSTTDPHDVLPNPPLPTPAVITNVFSLLLNRWQCFSFIPFF